MITANTLDRQNVKPADLSAAHINAPKGELAKIIGNLPAGMNLEQISVTCRYHGKATWFITAADKAAGHTGCQKCHWELKAAEQKKADARNEALKALSIPREHLGANFSTWRLVGDDALKARMSNILNFSQNYAKTYRRGHANILLSGNTGTGKTKLACIIANEIIRAKNGKLNVIFKRSADIQREIKQCWDRSSQESDVVYINRLGRADVLVIDEVGQGDTGYSDHAADKDRERLSDLIDQRYKAGLPTIITTNLPQADFYAHVGHRAADRLAQNIVYVACNWNSYRDATARFMSL